MKQPFLAFLLSFLFPGAGLWYLRRWRWGFINLAIVLALGSILAATLPEGTFLRYAHYVAIGCGGASAAIAELVAKRMNERRGSQQDATR